jgi:hypothetical protein
MGNIEGFVGDGALIRCKTVMARIPMHCALGVDCVMDVVTRMVIEMGASVIEQRVSRVSDRNPSPNPAPAPTYMLRVREHGGVTGSSTWCGSIPHRRPRGSSSSAVTARATLNVS